MIRRRGSFPCSFSRGLRFLVNSARTGMSAPASTPKRRKTSSLWLRKLPACNCITSPSSALMRAISISMCAAKRAASSFVASPRRARAKTASATAGELPFEVVVDVIGVLGGELLGDAEDACQLLGDPEPRGGAAEEVELLAEVAPDLAMVPLHGRAVGCRHAQVLHRDPLTVEHPEDVVVGDDE